MPKSYSTHSTSGTTKTYLIQSQPTIVTKEFLPTGEKTPISETSAPKEAKTQSNSTSVSKQMILTINKKFVRRSAKRKHYKQSALAELPNSDESNITTKN